MLSQIEEMGVRGEDSLKAEAAAEPVPEHFLASPAAGKKAEELLATAVEAAQAALDGYQETEDQLNKLWVVRANRAAVNHLLANLHTGPEADEYRNDAILMYKQAIQDRTDLPEAQPYQRIINSLTQTAP